jgi:uncharacterized membrane protein
VRPRRLQHDAGSITVLTIGLLTVLLALVAVVSDASAVFLARREVAAACDAAATAAAQAVDRSVVYGTGSGERLPLSFDDAQTRVAAWLALQRESGLTATLTGLTDGATTAVVSCERSEAPPLRSAVGLPSVRVTAHAEARSPLTP